MASGLFNLKQVNQAISQGAWSGYIAPRWVEYLVVAGGGGGAGSYTFGIGPGGGAGGLLTGIVTVAVGTSYTVTVGAGGTAGSASSTSAQTSGVNSVFGSISAAGGGYGAANSAPSSGGSGGGGTAAASASTTAGASGVAGQGNSGGTATLTANNGCGGGGGAGTKGLDGTTSVSGNGGAGIASSITGTVTTYAGGGGASGFTSLTAGTGGVGGGGSGSFGTAGASGSSNTGGGGGGAGYSGGHYAGGSGGSGIVVVRYPGNVQFYTGGTVTYSNGYIVHNFTANGTLAPTTPTVVSEYQISRSLRFNSPDGSYVARTFPSAGNRKTWTWSAWVKRSALGTTQQIFSSRPTGSPYALIYFANDQFNYADTSLTLTTTQVFRDVSAWYHIVIATDTTQATASDRLKFYINGVQVTAFSTATYPAQNYETQINTATQHNLSGAAPYGAEYFSGYMTEVNFVDGQALTATSFGYVNPTTGIWSPAKYVGGYGTNGFYLNFSDNSNTTAATLGKDYSGNGNNWTPNNFSVTAGAGNDSLVDSPTLYGTDTGAGGSVRGNYSTLNALSTGVTLSNGNLNATNAATGNKSSYSTIGVSSGKWYAEGVWTTTGSTAILGVALQGYANTDGFAGGTLYSYGYEFSGQKYNNGSGVSYAATWTNGDVIGVALDLDAGTITYYKNGTSQGTAFTGLSAGTYFIGVSLQTATCDINFGQRPFAYTAPSGFKALCTQNLPTPTIGATSATLAGKYFNTVLYTGTSASLNITGVGFQPDFSWLKSRSGAFQHGLFDAVRGSTKGLISNSTSDEITYDSIASFNTDGFLLGTAYNTSPYTYVAWNWRASNATAVTNTAGSITSTVSANTTSGFSIVTYTGTGSAGATVGHGLGAVPSMIIFKKRSGTSDWQTYHTSLGNANSVYLNLTNASAASPGMLNSTTPTSTLITLGTSTDTNPSTGTMVAYCFAPIAGYSAFGSYTGNGSTNGTFVYTGFKPAYVMIKSTATGSWWINDDVRDPYNVNYHRISANSSNAEATATFVQQDFLSNGFKWRDADPDWNANGTTYIYMAFAENPFKYALAR